MSTATSIVMQSVVKAAATNAVVTPINDVDYNLEAFRKSRCTVINAVRAIPSTIGGGDNGHIFLLEFAPTYTTRAGGTDCIKTTHPGAIDFTGATTNAQIARVKEMCTTALETYNKQEGVRAGLRKIIIVNVPAKLLVQHGDAESGLNEVE